jgi:transposase
MGQKQAYSVFRKPCPAPFSKKKNSADSGKFRGLMVYRNISKDLKERALWLISHEYAPEDICELFDISQRSITRWKQNDRIHGSIVPPPNPSQCRPRILNTDMTHDLYTLLQEAPEMYLSEIQDWVALAYETHISRTALHMNIRDAGISYKLLRRAAAERDEDLRQEWMEDVNAHFMASQMVFVDETSKDERTIYRHYGRSVSGSRATISANFVRGERYSMVAALSLDGYEAVRVVPGSVDGEEFLDYIVNDVVRCMFYLFNILLNHLPAAEHEPLPPGQEHPDSRQLCDSQDTRPSRNC